MNHTDDQSIDASKVLIYSMYIGIGAFMLLGNGLIMLMVSTTKELQRKEFYIPAGLALGEFSYAVGVFSAGIRRLYLVLNRLNNVKVTAWHCMLEFPNSFFFFGGQLQTIMLAALSIDRYIATAKLSLYMKLSEQYAVNVIRGASAYCFVSLVVAWILSYFEPKVPKFRAMCFSIWAVPKWYGTYNQFHRAFLGVSSVVIYVFTILSLRRQTSEVTHDSLKAQYHKRQVKVTKMIQVVMGMTFFLQNIPMTLILIMNLEAATTKSLNRFAAFAPIFWVMSIINSSSNIVIYLVRNRQMRAAALRIIRCKSQKLQNNSIVPCFDTGVGTSGAPSQQIANNAPRTNTITANKPDVFVLSTREEMGYK